MPGRDDGGTRGLRLFEAALEDPHTMVWLLDADGVVRRTDDEALALVDADEDAVVGEPFPETPWWSDAALDGRLRRALDGEFVRFHAPVAGVVLDTVLRPVTADGEVGSVVAVGRTADRSAGRREKLVALHDTATRLESADDEAAVHQLTVRGAVDVLSFDRCFVGVLEGETVDPRAVSEALPVDAVAGRALRELLATRVLSNGESVVVDDAATAAGPAPDDEHAAWLGVPIDDTALLVAADPDPGAFDAADRELADVLTAHAGAALRRVRTRQRLRRQNERLEEFASVVAHDLRNPLGAMRANLQVARELDDPEVLDAIERSLTRMDELLEDLLELASVGEDATEIERVTLSSTAREAWATAAPADATLSVGEDIAFEADPSRLQQLLENLFDNAVEHGGPDVSVTVGALDGHGFYVADDGPGIPEAERDDVFEHGFTTAEDGTGFGLSIVRRIAETHGWQPTVTTGEDGGARFEFTAVEAVDPR